MRANAGLVALIACWLAPTTALAQAATKTDLVLAGDAEPPPKGVRATIAVGCPDGDKRCEPPALGTGTNLFGVRVSETMNQGRGPKAGIGIVSESDMYLREPDDATTLHFSHFAALGGGRAGVEGGLGATFGFGLLGELGPNHGIFTRVGARGFFLGNSVLWASLLDVPELELGYQLLRSDLHLELAAHGGPVLTGRYNPDAARRPLGASFEWGAAAAARLGAVDFDLDLTRIEARDSDPGTAVNMLTALLCGGQEYFGVCFDARLFSGDVREGDSVHAARSAFIGIAIGGFTQNVPPPNPPPKRRPGPS